MHVWLHVQSTHLGLMSSVMFLSFSLGSAKELEVSPELQVSPCFPTCCFLVAPLFDWIPQVCVVTVMLTGVGSSWMCSYRQRWLGDAITLRWNGWLCGQWLVSRDLGECSAGGCFGWSSVPVLTLIRNLYCPFCLLCGASSE